ncbi:MAG: hypothetical protein HY903_17965 [Deltaproteobacteria bacterium]|nr:hypothetical protein [Deltaproteobacteria bacterium]
MKSKDALVDLVKEWLAVSNPGLVRREQLAHLEEQLDTILALCDELETRLATKSKGSAAPTDDDA